MAMKIFQSSVILNFNKADMAYIIIIAQQFK